MKRTIITALPLLLSLFLLSCTTPPDDSRNNASNEEEVRIPKLVVGTVMEVVDTNCFDPGLDKLKLMATHYGLVRFDKDGEITPALAESWDTDDLKRWVFHLRKDALWHDGVPVTSEDLAYTVKFGRQHIPVWHSAFGNIVSVEALDSHTVVFEIKEPDYNFLTTIAVMRPVPAHIFKPVKDPKRYNDKKAMVGTGPYAFDSFDPEAGIVRLCAFAGYWGGTPVIDTLEIRLFKNPETMMMAFRKGEIDVPFTYSKGVSYYYVPSLQKAKNIQCMIVKGRGFGNVLWLNNSRNPLNERNFRLALSYAVNYEEIKNLFTAGYGSIPCAGFTLKGTWGHVETRKMAFDLEKAKHLLETAGFRDRDGDGLRENRDGSPLALTLVASSAQPDQVRLCEMLKTYLAQAGVGIAVKLVDSGTFSTTMDIDKTFDMAISGTTPWGMTMGSRYGTGYVSTQYYGWSMVSAPAYDALVSDLRTTMDLDLRGELAAKIQHYYAEEMPQIPIYIMDIIQPHTTKYQGWVYSVYHGIMCPETFYHLRSANQD